MSVHDYYNDFYQELARIDAQNNSYDKFESLIPKEIFNRTDARVLDIGSGFGYVSEALIKKNIYVTAVEISDEALLSLHSRGFLAVKHDLDGGLPFKEGSFDVVILADILEHVFNPLALLAEAKRLLRPAGCVLVSVPLYFDIIDRCRILFTGHIVSYDNHVYGRTLHRRMRSYNYDHIRFFSHKDVIEMLKNAGFRPSAIEFVSIVSSLRSSIFGRVLSILASAAPSLFAHSMKVRAIQS